MSRDAALSLKVQIIKTVSLQALIAGLVVALFAFAATWHEIEEVYDAQLSHLAKVLEQVTQSEIAATGSVSIHFPQHDLGYQHKYENKVAFRIWYKGKLVAQSLRAQSFKGLTAPIGFSDQEIKGRPWRFYVYEDEEAGFKVETAQRFAIRYELIGQLVLSLLVPFLLFIPVLLGIIWLGVKKSLSPVERISRSVDERHSDDFAPIDATGLPQEVLPILQAMNRLFLRIADTFRREREFTDNAAHELRTPLAALKTQTQVLLKRMAQDKPIAASQLEDLHLIIDRATHLVDQLLFFSRLQAEVPELSDVAWSDLVTQIAHESVLSASNRHQRFDIDIAQGVRVSGNGPALDIMVRNVIDNAIKYTPEHGQISVVLAGDGKLSVADSGPGLTAAQRDMAFDRFVRFDATGQKGSGLGLSICRWIAQAHGWEIGLRQNSSHGLIVDITPAG